MGCGISQSVIHGVDDREKSDAFIKLCASEKNPLAIQLKNYFSGLTSECLYKSQGNMSSYERLSRSRPQEIRVNRSKAAALRHGIGHKPLTVAGVHDIMNLFLGHVIAALEQRKWSGEFNYTLLKAAAAAPTANTAAELTPGTAAAVQSPASPPAADGDTAGAAAAGTVPAKKPPTAVSDSTSRPNPFKLQDRNSPPPAALSVRSAAAHATVEAATPATPAATPATDRASASVPSALTPSTKVQSETIVFVDRGDGTRKDDDASKQYRVELTGHITYPSVDGALTLICDSVVTFLFFTCDDEPPATAPPPPLSATAESPPQVKAPVAPLGSVAS